MLELEDVVRSSIFYSQYISLADIKEDVCKLFDKEQFDMENFDEDYCFRLAKATVTG